MNLLEWLDLASLIARFLALVASPFIAGCSINVWLKGNKQTAMYLAIWAVFLQMLGT